MVKSRLSQIPLLRLLVPFAIGILLAILLPEKPIVPIALTLTVFALWIIRQRYFGSNANYKNRWIFGGFSALFLIFAGYSVAILREPESNKFLFSKYLHSNEDTVLATIISLPTEKAKTIKATAEINAVIRNEQTIKTNGKALLYFEKDSMAQLIQYGDVLFLRASLQPVKSPSNPDEFDYKKYLLWHGITREAFLRNGHWQFTYINNASSLQKFAVRCREKAISLLKNEVKGTEATLASAILLGYRDDLPQPLIQQFADSGVIHVICVAGLHVGILFGLIAWLLSPLKKIPHGKTIRLVITLVLLWFYALFTGFATPVVRATVMFSFIFVGQYFGRYSNSMNNLSASALLLLLWNPMSLADTGFQLSYLSVAGIIILYPMIYRLAEFRNFFLDKIWELVCLSLSAQLAIAPLSILYFHQFPNYFVFTNLLIVPLLALAICSGVLFFTTCYIPFVSSITALLLQKILALMEWLVEKMHHLPFFATKAIVLSVPEVIVLYLVLIALLVFAAIKHKPSFIIALSGLAFVVSERVWKNFETCKQQIFTIYNIPGHSAVAFIAGKHALLEQPIDSLDFCMHVQCNFWNRDVADSSSLNNSTDSFFAMNNLYYQPPYVQFNRLKIAFIRKNEDVPHASIKMKMNYLVLSGGYKLDMATLEKAFIFDKLIFDSSVSNYRCKKWEDECDRLHIPYYNVAKYGAFIEKTES